MAKTQQQQEADLIRSWRLDPIKFVEECLGIHPRNKDENGKKMGLSNQQKQGLHAVGQLARAKDIVAKFKDGVVTKKPTDEQFKLSAQMGVSVMAGKGVGKDAFASWVILWMLCTHVEPKILCTAPTQGQLKQVLWSEIAMWHGKRDFEGNALFQMKHMIAVEGEKIYMKGVTEPGSNEKDGKYWTAFYRTPQRNVDKAQMAKTLSGLHANNMMFVLDEASGIDDAVFGDLENTMTGRVNFSLLIFNPHKPNGFAYDTHYGKHKHQWIQCHWDAEESDLVPKQSILNLEEKYGRESDNFLVNVKGLPPRGGDDSLIPYEWVYAAYNRELIAAPDTQMIVGVDVARGGTDYTVVTPRLGGKVFKPYKIVPSDFNQQADEIDRILKGDLCEYTIAKVCIDATGVGHGLVDVMMRRHPGIIASVKVAESPRKKDKFRKLRDELWWKMRTRFEHGTIEVTEYKDLLEELHCVGFSQATGKIIVDNKDKIKQKLGRSCDFADSLMLTFYADDTSEAPLNDGDGTRRQYGQRTRKIIGRDAPISVNGFMYL